MPTFEEECEIEERKFAEEQKLRDKQKAKITYMILWVFCCWHIYLAKWLLHGSKNVQSCDWQKC